MGKDSPHQWIEKGRTPALHVCVRCAIIKEFSSPEFHKRCWVPLRASKAAQDALEGMK